ncbi:hypothetical protein VNO77_42565 [Canavalia gladiata]|uniref:Uncharacterized protein n=1 Tax=Canavalia gladiata TaxID=3824 RepID=A0AAN9JUR7_CANGL
MHVRNLGGSCSCFVRGRRLECCLRNGIAHVLPILCVFGFGLSSAAVRAGGRRIIVIETILVLPLDSSSLFSSICLVAMNSCRPTEIY